MKTKIILLLLFLFDVAFAQELPPIINYNPNVYAAGNQNWMLTQTSNQYIFSANNEGLLEFNGSNWHLYPSPNETIIRSVKAINDRIYTGCYMEFGFWTRQANGKLKYSSLSDRLKNKILTDEQFWNILSDKQWVIFQSLNRIYLYDTIKQTFKMISPRSNIIKSYASKQSIYFQTDNEGLFQLNNGKVVLVSNHPVIKQNRIINVFDIHAGLLIQTQSNGFYTLKGSTISKFVTEADAQIETGSVYSSLRLSEGSYAVGTVSKGIFILTKEGKIRYHISQSKGLGNNTALSLFEDMDNNLWIGLDNGITCINVQSPIHTLTDDTGELGTVYAFKLFNGKLYVGTNQGLFYKNYPSKDNFKFIGGTKGQVWSLFEYKGTLFCGHDSGTFLVENGSVNRIFSKSGTWKFEAVPHHDNLLLQGNYYGVSVLEKKNKQWVFRNKVTGFDYSSRYFEITNSREVYVSHEYKGIFRFQLDDNLLTTSRFVAYSFPKKGRNASLISFNDAIYYAYKDGVFKLNAHTKQFEKDVFLSSVFEKDKYTSGKLTVDDSNNLWMFSTLGIHYFSWNKAKNQLQKNSIPIPASLTKSMLGFENITQVADDEYLIGTTDGFYRMNIKDMNFKDHQVLFTSVVTNRLGAKPVNMLMNAGGDFKYDNNNITFSYTVPEYDKYINTQYQYFLQGFQKDWSDWDTKTSVTFENLPSGHYHFRVRAKFANRILDNTVTYPFTILKPWYATRIAIFFYILLLGMVGYFINKAYLNYYRKQREKLIEENNLLLEIQELENEHQLMKLRNEQLSMDVDIKNRDLAVSTINLQNKNELLEFIKEDLKKTNASENSNIKSVISAIDNNITGKDSWRVFKEAFDSVDKDFLKRIKQAHPSLTPNDLRLCAYLRLNLSSKEVAPMFNISVRSVEIKRYRLRKKLDLLHNQGLVEYIMGV